MIRFDGRAVLVTGAGRGLGRAYAKAFAARGAAVLVHDAGVGRAGEDGDPGVADAVVDEIRADGGEAVASYENLESEEACLALVEHAVAKLGRLDVVVNNVGLVVYEGMTSEECALTGVVLAAAGGRFAVRQWARSSGIDFGREPAQPEQLAERLPELAAPTDLD